MCNLLHLFGIRRLLAVEVSVYRLISLRMSRGLVAVAEATVFGRWADGESAAVAYAFDYEFAAA